MPHSFPRKPLAAALLLMGALPAHAQGTPPAAGDPVPTLPTVRVQDSAPAPYKSEEARDPQFTQPLVDTPQTINVVPEAVIEQRAATTLRDVLRNVPGISMQAGEGGVPAGDQLTIRGFSARTDLFVDGVRDFGGYARDPFNLEQVEVVKGPASTYSGRGSTGGYINLVSKTPRLNAFSQADLSVGTDAYKRLTADLSRPLGDGKNTALRLNLMVHDAEVPGRGEVEVSRWGIAPSVAFGLGGDTRLTLSYFHMSQDNLPDYGLPWVPATNVPLAAYANRAPPVDFENFYGLTARDYEDIGTDIASAEFEHDFNDALSVRNLLRYGRTGRDSIITAPRFLNNNSTLVRRNDWKSRDQTDTILANLTDFTYAFKTGSLAHTLVAGLELTRETEENFIRVKTGPDSPATDLFNPNPSDPYLDNIQPNGTKTDADADGAAVYVADTVKFSEQWQASGGLRWDRYEVDYQAADGTRFARTDSEPSWRAALVYKPRPEGSVYAGYGSSFNPSAEGLSLANTTGNNNPATNSPNLEPEENRTYEFGAKWELADRRLLLSGAVFRTEKTNARTQDPDDPNDLIVLEGEQRVDGFEVGLAGSLTRAWQLYGGYAYLDSEVVESNDTDEVGNKLPNTPRGSFNLWTTYDLPGGVQLGGGALYVGDRYSSLANTRLAESYWTYDALVAWRVNRSVELRLNLLNLGDEEYIDYVGGGHFIPGQGRQVLLTGSFRF